MSPAPSFDRLIHLCREMDVLIGMATELYRSLAREVRSLTHAGVSENLIAREMIVAGRTASRASELCTIARLPDAQFESYMNGELGFRAALYQARRPARVRRTAKTPRPPRDTPELPPFPRRRGRPTRISHVETLLGRVAALLHLLCSDGGYWRIGGFGFTIARLHE